MFKQANTFIGICLFGLNLPLAHAVTSTAIINVSLIVTNFCSVTAAPLGSQSARPDADNKTSIFTINCSRGAGYAIELDQGQNITNLSRKMRRDSPSAYINYNLYLESGHKIPWITNSSLLGTGANQAIMTLGSPLSTQEIRNTGSAGNPDQIFATITY